MDSRLHRIEALPGAGRYAVTFRRRDGSEHTAVVTTAADLDTAVPPAVDAAIDAAVDATDEATGAADTELRRVLAAVGAPRVEVAEASLPPGWTRDAEPFLGTARAVVAVDLARASVADQAVLRDVTGGWDVGLGNVILSAQGRPSCTAHGEMRRSGEENWECETCGARALYTL